MGWKERTNEVFQQDKVDPDVDERDAAANEVGAARRKGVDEGRREEGGERSQLEIWTRGDVR